MGLEIRQIAFDTPEFSEEVRLRHRILRAPLGLEFDPEDLAREGGNNHFGAYLEGVLVGTLQMVPLDGKLFKMRQVAVDVSYQGYGLGRRLVVHAEDFARGRGAAAIVLNARCDAIPFYLAMGYEEVGEIFTEVGIPHKSMRKAL